MCPGPIQKLQSEATSQERGATHNSLKQTTAKPALAPQRDTCARQSKAPTSDISTAVERKNDTANPERKSIERKHAVRKQPQRQSGTPQAGAQPLATSPDHSNETDDHGPFMEALGNHASALGKESSMRKNSGGEPSGVVRDEIAPLAQVHRQEQEVSPRDKPAISPETDAVPMQRLPIDSIIEEASQYHPDRARSLNFRLLSEAFGSQDPDFVWGLVGQLADASTRFNDAEGLNFMIAAIKNIHPRDVNEAMLQGQIAAVNMSMMNYVDELARLQGTPQQEMAERAVNRLGRTFATLVGALKNYRTGGEQKPTFGHVSVNGGGQTIVGTVNQAPRDVLPEKTPNATPALTDARQTAMEMVGERKRKPVPQRCRHTDD